MLRLEVSSGELWNETTEQFVYSDSAVLELEHSLVSLAKWEEKWHVPFLGKEEKTDEQIKDYIRCMALNNPDPEIFNYLTAVDYQKISDYINDSHTATTIKRMRNQRHSREVVSAELIYYWMTALNISEDKERWHLNRLLTFIEVCNLKNTPQKKMSKSEIYQQNRAINEANKKFFSSKG